MQDNLPIVYLSVLLVILAAAGVTILTQVFKTRRLEKALTRLQNKLGKEKGTALDYYELGSIFLDKKLFAQAIPQFQKALKSDELEGSALAAVHNALGFAYFAQEQYDLALRTYKEALKAYPEYVTALNNLGHAYERKNLAAKALESYEQALQYDPKNGTAKKRAESLRKRMSPAT
ncbi:MAG: tetratricopeptide repeat protein [Synechococcales bacterium]|nr:tetratricopeptide repeat protein [Synechococcales bacterium]